MVSRYAFVLILTLCFALGMGVGPARADDDSGVSAKDDPRKKARDADDDARDDDTRDDDDVRDDKKRKVDDSAKRKKTRKKSKNMRLKNKRGKTTRVKAKRGKKGDTRATDKLRGKKKRSKLKQKGKIKKRPVKKPVKKPKKKKKKPREEPLPYGLGLKVGVMPYNSMEAYPTDGGRTDYDMRMAYGYGLGGQIRIMQSFYLTGELMYWITEVRKREGATGGPRETDGLLNLGGGLRLNVYGGDYTKDRVYIKGLVGFTSYIADDANEGTTGGDNRNGIYYGGSLGIEHKLARTLTIYADSGFYWNKFNNPAQDEDEAEFFNWQAAAGFMYHWK